MSPVFFTINKILLYTGMQRLSMLFIKFKKLNILESVYGDIPNSCTHTHSCGYTVLVTHCPSPVHEGWPCCYTGPHWLGMIHTNSTWANTADSHFTHIHKIESHIHIKAESHVHSFTCTLILTHTSSHPPTYMHTHTLRTVNVTLPRSTLNNGTLYAHVFIGPKGKSPTTVNDVSVMSLSVAPLTKYSLLQSSSFNLLFDGSKVSIVLLKFFESVIDCSSMSGSI